MDNPSLTLIPVLAFIDDMILACNLDVDYHYYSCWTFDPIDNTWKEYSDRSTVTHSLGNPGELARVCLKSKVSFSEFVGISYFKLKRQYK